MTPGAVVDAFLGTPVAGPCRWIAGLGLADVFAVGVCGLTGTDAEF